MYRIISLEKDFMDKAHDDIVFAALIGCSTYNPEKNEVYTPKYQWAGIKKRLASAYGCSTRTIQRKLDKWAEDGLITPSIYFTDDGGSYVEVYVIKQFFDGSFMRIDNDFAYDFTTIITKPHAFRIYCYLKNKNEWKHGYRFSLKKMCSLLGYAQNSRINNGVIKEAIGALEDNGLLTLSRVIIGKDLLYRVDRVNDNIIFNRKKVIV